ncbi:MAG: hypothetical protein GX102_04740 [Porphyromonadaceae bacterium]|nr:hypothetical protein [Porphyromonadaceae bacterium]
MTHEEYNWTSTHDFEKSVYDFGNGYKIIHDKKMKMCYKTKNGDVIDSFSDEISLNEFEKIQINFIKAIK